MIIKQSAFYTINKNTGKYFMIMIMIRQLDTGNIIVLYACDSLMIPWGPLPGGQGGRPPPPDFGGEFFNTFRPPPRFWRVL